MSGSIGKRFLILSDGKPGHLNQSIAFARHLNRDYDVCKVSFVCRAAKALSYVADRFGFYTSGLFKTDPVAGAYQAVVSAGSETYYANRSLAKRHNCSSVAIMLPKGYRYSFDLIVAQQHDQLPGRENILSLPVNLSYIEPQGLVSTEPGERYISLIIGGDSRAVRLDKDLLASQVEQILQLFPDHRVWMTTSRRTSPEVEDMLKKFNYERAVFYSQEPINPIPDFLAQSDYVFLTADSSSMVSEAVSFGTSCVEVLPLSEDAAEPGKFGRLLDALETAGCLHLFDGTCGQRNRKISLSDILNKFYRGNIAR